MHQQLLLADFNWTDARACFEAGPKVLPRLERGEGGRFLTLAARVARDEPREALPFLMDCSRALAQVDRALHSSLLKLAEELLSVSCAAAMAFLKNCPAVLAKLKSNDLERWYAEGVAVLGENQEAGLAYFSMESARCQQVLERLCCGVELDRIKTSRSCPFRA